ncbi:MAG TPA: FtsX-like permease family protein [Symbiobacteriaceae bacterium]|nr:FtsX-like permease family protein [Symbiobacteriaceae bacterium]
MMALALKNLWNRKTRSLLTILGIAVAIQLYVVMSGIMDSFDDDLQKQVAGMAGRLVVQQKSDAGTRFPPLDSVIEATVAEAVLTLEGVDTARSSPVLLQVVVPPPAINLPPVVMAAGVVPGREFAFTGNTALQAQLKGEHDAILGAAAAGYYGAKAGDTISVQDESFVVVAVLPETNMVTDGVLLLPLPTAQRLFLRHSLVSAVMLTATSADGAKPLAAAIESAHPKLLAATADDVARSANELLAIQRKFFAAVNSTALAVAAVVVMIVMVMAIFERKKEIGTLKAIGASTGRILCLIMTESLTLSVVGGLVALPASTVINGLILGEYHIDLSKWLQTLAVAVLLGVIASLWPAWAAQRVHPLESLTYE